MSEVHDELIYTSKTITPEQSSLLKRPNFAQYPTEQELSESKDSELSQNGKEDAEENAESKEKQASKTEEQSDAVEQKDTPTTSIKEIVQRFKKLEKERKELFEKDAFSEQYDEIIFKLKEFLESLTDEQLSKLKSKVGFSFYIDNELEQREKKAEEEKRKGAFDTAMQSQGEVERKADKKKAKVADFVSKDPKRVALTGVYHGEDGYAVATDTCILVGSKREFDKKQKGKIIGKGGKEITGYKYPDYNELKPKAENLHDSGIDTSDLRAFINGVKDRLKKDGRKPKEIEKAVIAVRGADGMLYYGSIPILERFVQFCDENGLKIKHVFRGYNDIKDVTNLLYAEGNEAFALSIGIANNKYLDYYPDDAWVYHNEGFQFAYDAMHKPRLEKSDGKASEVSSTDALLRDALADVMRESGIEVITDNKEAQRVLEEENKKTPLIGQPNRANEKPTSGSVLAFIRRDSSSNPTTSKQASAKVKNDTQSAKNKIKKYFNGDFLISKTDVNKAFVDFGKMFAMQDKGGSRYSILQTNSGKTIAIRISNHTAKGDNFKQDNADSNLSIVIEQYKYDNATDSNVEYTEVTIPYEAYRNKPTEVIDAIVNGVNDALADKEFSLSSELGTVEKKEGEQANTGNKNVRFFRTASGEAYGFTVDGKVYLDHKIAGAETAIHEYTHLWATALKNANPKEWSNIVSLLKGTPLWDKVASEYPELTTDDELADEVLAHYSGKRGAERLRKEAESIANGKGSLLDKAGAISALERVKEALTRFWKATADLLHIHFTTAEEVADKVLADLLNGVNPNETAREYRRKQKQLERINETNPMLDDYHVGIRGLSDIKTMREAIEEARQEAEEGDYETLSAYPDITNEMLENALLSGKITVYSSKPIKDGNFVTPSRMQAEDYAGDGRVYSKTVSIDDVAWINTDEGQFVKNRKDKAEKAPLRFQFIGEQSAEDSTSGEDLEEVNARFNEELQQQIDGTLPQGHIYNMGRPGKILLSTGIPNLPIQMNATKLKDKSTKFGHDYELSEVKDLVRALQHPLAVFAYGNKTKAQNIIIPLKQGDKNFIVGLSLNPVINGRKLEINSIRNVFPKNNAEWLNWITQGKTLYLDKEKIQTLIDQQQTILADVEYLDLDLITKVAQSSDNPSIEGENLYRKPVGGNSGYVGYSMSKRAERAREEGRFPKTDFKREYKVSESSLQALSRIGIISDNEWHHTSSYGNRTTFYGWTDDAFAEYYLEHKKEIDKATDDLLRLKEENIDKYFSALDDFRKEMRKSFDAYADEYNKEQELREDAEKREEEILSAIEDTLFYDFYRPFEKAYQNEWLKKNVPTRIDVSPMGYVIRKNDEYRLWDTQSNWDYFDNNGNKRDLFNKTWKSINKQIESIKSTYSFPTFKKTKTL